MKYDLIFLKCGWFIPLATNLSFFPPPFSSKDFLPLPPQKTYPPVYPTDSQPPSFPQYFYPPVYPTDSQPRSFSPPMFPDDSQPPSLPQFFSPPLYPEDSIPPNYIPTYPAFSQPFSPTKLRYPDVPLAHVFAPLPPQSPYNNLPPPLPSNSPSNMGLVLGLSLGLGFIFIGVAMYVRKKRSTIT